MYAPLRLRVWLVEPSDSGMLDGDDPPADADVLDEDAFRRALDAGQRPDALLVEETTLERLDGQRIVLDGILRTVIVTDRPIDDLPTAYLDRPSIRILRRPVTGVDLTRAVLWLSGVEDDGWAVDTR